MVQSRDALNTAFIGDDLGIATDIYKFESVIGTLVTYNFGNHSSTPDTATSRNLHLGTNIIAASKVTLSPKDNQCAITKINGVELAYPICVHVGAPYEIKYGKFISSMEIYFDTDNTILQVQAVI